MFDPEKVERYECTTGGDPDCCGSYGVMELDADGDYVDYKDFTELLRPYREQTATLERLLQTPTKHQAESLVMAANKISENCMNKGHTIASVSAVVRAWVLDQTL